MPKNQSISSFPYWSFQSGTGRLYLNLELWDTGNGFQGLLTGGEKPHIGGVVLALPRPSLSGEGWSADLYLTPVPSHKDVDLASPLAGAIARLSHFPVVMTAGIHSDSLTPEELDQMKKNFTTLMEQALQELENFLTKRQ